MVTLVATGWSQSHSNSQKPEDLTSVRWAQVVILIGTGWSYLKVFLAEKEKKILMVVIPLQVMAEVAIIILDEDTPAARNWCAALIIAIYSPRF